MIDTSREIPNLYQIRTVVLIAGVRVPHSSVTISSAFNTIPTCTIAVPPFHKLFGLGRFDRLPVQVFIKDVFGSERDLLDRYILLFEGDVTGFGYSNTAIGREFAINAHGVLAFLKDIEVEFLTSVRESFLSSITNRGLAKLSTTAFAPSFPLSLFTHGISQVEEGNMIQYPSDFLENVYRFITQDIAVEKLNDSVLAEYYANYAKQKIRLLDRYQVLPFFDKPGGVEWTNTSGSKVPFPILRYIQSQAGMALLNDMMRNGPPTNSIYDIITFIVSQMEYEFAFFAAPILKGGKLVSSCLKPIFYDAQPPECNIIYSSHASSIRTEENVYQVPTRIKTESVDSILQMIAGDNPELALIGTINFYPMIEGGGSAEHSISTGKVVNAHNLGLLENEEFTGPYVYETTAPFWMMQIDTHRTEQGNGEDYATMKDQILKTMLQLKQYEYRAVSVETAFNPYVVTGFPGVIYDNADTNIALAGQFLATTHTISKNSAATTIEVGFSRSLEEAATTPIENTFKEIYDLVTSNSGNMSQIYQELLGCNSANFGELHTTRRHNSDYANPKEAYKANYRPIVSIPEYAGFLGVTATAPYWVHGVREKGDLEILGLIGAYFQERYKPEIVDILKEMSNTEYDSLIYNY